MNPVITIAVQCHNFQKRLCWMLSSLAQQTQPELVQVDVACMIKNGQPTTEDVCEVFQDQGLLYWLSAWTDYDKFQRRGLVRNYQLKECETEWLMFGDCDMVYHPTYFDRLMEFLAGHANATYMLSTGRTSNPKELTDKMVDKAFTIDSRAAREVVSAFEQANALPKRPMRNCGAGFSQIINVKHCPHGGYYVTQEDCRDWDWAKSGSNPKSDMQFRRRIGKMGGPLVKLPIWFSENAIHLNHDRDPEAGRHLEHQR